MPYGRNVNISATSDLHGVTHLEIPEADVLVIAGDVCPTESHTRRYQLTWMLDVFLPWLDRQPVEHIVWLAGNHDFLMEEPPDEVLASSRVRYLQDEAIEIDGVRFWGTPWVRPVVPGSWAFSVPEHLAVDERNAYEAGSDWRSVITIRDHSSREGVSLDEAFARIPFDIDVLVTHSPPSGVCDTGVYPEEHAHQGSFSLRSRIEVIQPHLLICGHIHEGYGEGLIDSTIVANVAQMDAFYRSVNPPMTFEINPKERQ